MPRPLRASCRRPLPHGETAPPIAWWLLSGELVAICRLRSASIDIRKSAAQPRQIADAAWNFRPANGPAVSFFAPADKLLTIIAAIALSLREIGGIGLKTILIVMGLAAASCTQLAAADAAAGKDVFDKSCKSCHGADGTPNANVAKMMKVDIKDLKSSAVQGMSDADLKGVITNGKGKMKPVTSVTGASLDNVVAYVRTLKK